MFAEERSYSDYIQFREEYAPAMTKEEINAEPDKWLNFFPHQKFCEFFEALLNSLESGTTSVWLYGNYGTGKSHAALVTQKLFMDATERVERWFEKNKAEFADPKKLKTRLDMCRKEGTLVVYDYNAQGLGPDDEFLVRLEKGISAALKEAGMKVPGSGNLDEIEGRLQREGNNFFSAMSDIKSGLSYLPTYKTIDEIVRHLHEDKLGATILDEVQQVFHHDGIFLDIDVPSFRRWLQKVRDVNGLERVVYIFDEFSSFIETNKTQLKTMEEVTENPHREENRFYFVPVTHMQLSSFTGENSQTAKRAKNRFVFKKIEMPDDVAFRLTAHAFRIAEEHAEEWSKIQDKLASNIAAVVDRFSKNNIKRDAFTKILPIHPMTAFILKYLSESVHSNQRSIFEYVNGKEFKKFIKMGGPESKTDRFLTVDKLWEYFIEREDLGVVQNVERIRREFNNIKRRILSNSPDDSDEIRVLKSVFLYVLISELLDKEGDELIQPTVDNIELAFLGSGLINVSGIIEMLSKKNCFSLANKYISLFLSESGTENEIEKAIEDNSDKFHEFLKEPLESRLNQLMKTARAPFFGARFDIHVSDPAHTNLGSFKTATRDKYSYGINKDDGSVRLWFVIAKNESEKTSVQEKVEIVLNQLREHRILMFSFGDRTFCEMDVDNWKNYSKLRAQAAHASDSAQVKIFETSYKKIENDWLNRVASNEFEIYFYDDISQSVVGKTMTWEGLKAFLEQYLQNKLPYIPDFLAGGQTTALGNSALKRWALAGIRGKGDGQYGQLANRFIKAEVSWDERWFAQNPEHSLSIIHAFFEKKVENTVGRGTDFLLRKAYIELKRAPYGMRPCGITAFCLGFCLRFLLAKGYQWTDRKITQELMDDSLAEIIESVVKDDGDNKIKDERTICKLSREEKAFVKHAPEMFGITSDPTSRVEEVLTRIQDCVRQLSDHAPLWTLHLALDADTEISDDEKQVIKAVLSMLCEICRTSSKSKTPEFTNNVKEIGAILSKNPNLIKIVAKYTKRKYFKQAFELYVDEKKPEFLSQAKKVGDDTRKYCASILEKVAVEGGVLWNEVDFSREIEETFAEYKAIERCQDLLGTKDFLKFDQVVEQLRLRVQNVNVPKAMILSANPSLQGFISSIDERRSARELNENLDQHSDTIREIFFDAQRKKILELVRSCLTQTDISDEDLRQLIDQVPDTFSMTPKNYEAALGNLVKEFEKNSSASRLAKAWKSFSGYDTPDEWAAKNFLPARFLFDDDFDSDSLFNAIVKPDLYSQEALLKHCERLEAEKAIPIPLCQKRFVQRVVPDRYSGFNIQFGVLTTHLLKKYGLQPNNWPVQLDVSEFINEQYRYSFAPQIVERIKRMAPEELKVAILELVKTNQDVGMYFWE